jgi:O-antigen/teichoic acid export membrane protein
MNEPQQIGRNTAILGLAKLVVLMSGIVVALLIARKLHTAGLGTYSAAMAYYGLIITLVDSGGTLLLAREIGKDRSKTNYYLVHLCVVGSFVSTLLMCILSIGLPHTGLTPSVASAAITITPAIAAGTLISFQESVFVAHQKTEFVTLSTLVTTAAFTAASALLLVHGYGITSILIAFVITQYIYLICNFYFIQRYISSIRWEFRFSSLPALFREIMTFTGLSTLASLFSRPELIIISFLSTTSQIGIYSSALRVVSLWDYIPQVFMTNVFPVLARSYHVQSKVTHVLQDNAVKYLLALSLPLAAGIMVTAEQIVSLLYGPGFASAVTPLRILALNIPLVSLWAVLWRVMVARDQQGRLVRMMLVVTCVELVGGGLLIVRLGSLGASISTTVSSLFYVLLLGICLRRSGGHIPFWALSWRFCLAAVVMGIVTWACRSLLQLWMLVPLAALTYGVLVFVLRAFSADDLALFRRVRSGTPNLETQQGA